MRTLQRHLQIAGTSHRKLLNEVRAGLAEEYHRGGQARRQEIADALAYSSMRSLERVFRRWRNA